MVCRTLVTLVFEILLAFQELALIYSEYTYQSAVIGLMMTPMNLVTVNNVNLQNLIYYEVVFISVHMNRIYYSGLAIANLFYDP